MSHYIHSYTSSIGTLQDQEGKFLARAYPTIMTQFIFEFFGETNEIHMNGILEKDERLKVESGTYVKVGLHSWIDIYRLPAKKARAEKFFKVDLYPHALLEIFNISPKELIGAWDIKLADIIGASTTSLLCKKLWECATGKQMVDVFEHHMTEILLKNTKKVSHYPFSIFSKMNKWSNASSVEVARKMGYSERWVQKKCHDMTGMSLKQMQGNLRFLKALSIIHQTLFSQNPKKLTHIASECGYYDQAHFAKDFKKYAGVSPMQYMYHLMRSSNQYQIYLCDIHSSASKSLHSAKSFSTQKIIVDLDFNTF
ncbi:helix-turn-helix transcriptional regulator [Sulfurospirillum sp. T05]|uniref:Helix-turn-helix transcriptional regulator n=1 Tax=Sulfurospirillum tamanense TaxID=2813362 RepID=A0ABS2WSU9_9BACT|nr:helix-turn-helix transcriptional regulator [Sulfurospirillum tamanensis]MBN2964701.1 helix-turn-helix transcriptional regulator [Sulfurospirillum tamanensis]